MGGGHRDDGERDGWDGCERETTRGTSIKQENRGTRGVPDGLSRQKKLNTRNHWFLSRGFPLTKSRPGSMKHHHKKVPGHGPFTAPWPAPISHGGLVRLQKRFAPRGVNVFPRKAEGTQFAGEGPEGVDADE